MATQFLTPALVLFGTKGIKLYHRWQDEEQIEPLDGRDELPSAMEYHFYLEWRETLRLRYLREPEPPISNTSATPPPSDQSNEPVSPEAIKAGSSIQPLLADICKHPIHPAHPQYPSHHLADAESDMQARASLEEYALEEGEIYDETRTGIPYCPLCIMTAHLTLLTAVTTSWETYGGPWRGPVRNAFHAHSKISLISYHRVKTSLANLILELETQAEEESSCESSLSPGEPVPPEITLAKPYSATAAISEYTSTYSYPTSTLPNLGGSIQHTRAGLLPLPPPTTTKPKSVVFEQQSVALADANHHSRDFHRNSVRYNPRSSSPYLCQDSDGWTDTSFFNSYAYTISQSRILLLSWSPQLNSFTYHDVNPSHHPSFTDNPSVTRLLELIESWLVELEGEMGVGKRREMEKGLSERSHYWGVYKTEQGGDAVVEAEGDADFGRFCLWERLVGTVVEGWARRVGDIGEEDEEGDVEEGGEGEMEGVGMGDEGLEEELGLIEDEEGEEDEESEDSEDEDVEMEIRNDQLGELVEGGEVFPVIERISETVRSGDCGYFGPLAELSVDVDWE